MAEEKIEEVISDIKKLSRIYWKIGLIIILGIFFFGAVALVIFFWQLIYTLNLSYPALLGEWTVRMLIEFSIRLLFWEGVFVGVPGFTIGISIIIYWWNKLPEEDKQDFLTLESRIWKKWSLRAVAVILAAAALVGVGGISFIMVIFTSHIDIEIGKWTIQYVLTVTVITGMLSFVIFGLPALVIAFIYWYTEIYRNRSLH